MSNNAVAYHLQRREVARGSREEIVDEKTKATTPPLPPSTLVGSPSAAAARVAFETALSHTLL